ncbi:DinB family protein, partial [bacterium]|nr:DinB family protein [bacterium]
MSTETKQAPNVAGVLAMQFRFAGGTFAQNTNGITHEESLIGPASGGNCMQWVAAHLLIARNSILELLGQPPVRDREEL